MNNLANVFAKLGRFPEAAALHHRAWTLRGQKLGLEHPDAQMSQRNLAVVLKILGKDGEAAEILSASREKLGRLQLEMRLAKSRGGSSLGAFMSLDLGGFRVVVAAAGIYGATTCSLASFHSVFHSFLCR